MFLNQLSAEEKKAFANLSVQVAKANGEVAEEEKGMIREYCKEMEIPVISLDDVWPMDKIISVFSDSNMHVKRIVLLETLGLVYADGNYDEAEQGMVKDYAEQIGLSSADVEEQTDLIKRYIELLKEIAMAVD